MEQKDNNNYVNIMGQNSAQQPEKKEASKIIIHTMPKKYMPAGPAKDQSKTTGFLILIFGFIFLIVVLVALYFLVLKKSPLVENSPLDETVLEKDATSTEETIDNAKEETKPSKVIENPAETNQASSSEETGQENASSSTSNYFDPNDSDKDGLSDLEELALGSSPNSQDTDSDTYADATEVKNLYDPTSKGYLVDSLNVEQYDNSEYNFSIFIMSIWTVEKISGNDSLIIPLGKDQYIQINSQLNTNNQTIEDWYKELFEVGEIKEEQLYKKGNWRGVIKENKLTVYLEHPNKKYFITLNYEIGNDNTLYYKNIFNMMMQSISVID